MDKFVKIKLDESAMDEVGVSYFNPNFERASSTQNGISSSATINNDAKAKGDHSFPRAVKPILNDEETSSSELTSPRGKSEPRSSWKTAERFPSNMEPLELSKHTGSNHSPSAKESNHISGSTVIVPRQRNIPNFKDIDDDSVASEPSDICSVVSAGIAADFVGYHGAKSVTGTRIVPSRQLFISLPEVKSDPACSMYLKTFSESGYGKYSEELWKSMPQMEKSEAKESFLALIRDGNQTNTKVYIGNLATFECHSVVLKSYSELCRNIDDLRELDLPETLITPRAFERVYEWMLNDTAFLQYDGIVEQYQAAKFLGIDDLSQQIWAFLDNFEVFREETACFTLLEAKKFNDYEICEFMLRRIQNFFIIFVASPEFFCLTAKEVSILLFSELIAVNSEIEVFLAAIRWLHFNWPEREEHVLTIMQSVRFHEMPTLYIVDLHTKTRVCPEIAQIIANKDVEDLIYKGFLAGNIQDSFNEIGVRRFSDKPFTTRQLKFDVNCEHHHVLKCVNKHLVTYAAFQKHLKKINAAGAKYYYSTEFASIEDEKIRCCQKPNFRQN